MCHTMLSTLQPQAIKLTHKHTHTCIDCSQIPSAVRGFHSLSSLPIPPPPPHRTMFYDAVPCYSIRRLTRNNQPERKENLRKIGLNYTTCMIWTFKPGGVELRLTVSDHRSHANRSGVLVSRHVLVSLLNDRQVGHVDVLINLSLYFWAVPGQVANGKVRLS